MNNTPLQNTDWFPPELQAALKRFEQRWRALHTFTVIGLLLLIPLISFGLLAISDRIWATPDWARFLLAVPVPLLLVSALWPWLKRWVLQRPNARQLAQVMGKLDRRVGDRLLGAVELSEGTHENWEGSPALRKAAIQQVARELATVKAEEKLDTEPARKLGIAATALLVASLSFTLLAPEAARNSFQRWLRPHETVERFTFVRFEELPDEVNTAHGEPFAFTGRVAHVRGERVRDVDVRLNGPESLERELIGETLEVRGDGLTQSRDVSLRAGDASARVRINPLLRPELVAMGATIHWPEYLNREPEELQLRRRRLEVPLGSQVRLSGTVSRELAAAEASGLGIAEIFGADFRLPSLAVDGNQTVTLQWTDAVGLTPRNPATVDVVGRPDEPPRVAISGIPPAVAVLPDEFLNLDISARDDFGLKRVWARMRIVEDGAPVDTLHNTEIYGISGSEELVFSPERFGFTPGTMIDLVAMAVDAYPERSPSISSRHRILVLSKEDHAKQIMQQMDSVLADLDETIRQEALALEENRALSERADEDLADEATVDELLDRAVAELARAERLMDTQRRMERLIAESTKNDQISDELIGDWTRIAQDLQNRAVPAMQAAAEAMREAAAASAALPDDADGDGDATAGEGGEGAEGSDAEMAGGESSETGEPGDGDATAGDPSEGDPMAGDPSKGDPMAGDPSEGDPMAGDPSGGEPMAGDPSGGEPMAGEPSDGGGSPPPGGQPQITQPQPETEQQRSERRERLEEAIRRQEEAIAAMQQGEQDLNESIEQSLSESFINRLRELARTQLEVGQRMLAILPQTLSQPLEELPPELAAILQAQADRQGEIMRETRFVYDDLLGFFRRTQNQIFRDVTLDMEAERFENHLPEMQEMIVQNITGRLIPKTEEWNGLFLRWAEMLSDDDSPPPPGDGGGDGAESEGETLETMIALIRARERQENLRRHTRALDQSYATNMNYDREAVELSNRQFEAARAIQQLETRVRTDDVKTLVSMASGEMMNAGVNLRRPQTDSETIAIQTAVIELLAAALDQSMNNPPPESDDSQGGQDQQDQQQNQQMQNQQMMQALMQMMQMMQAGDQGGEGQTGFGDPGRADHTGPGMRNRMGEETEPSAAAADPSRWPSTYRNLMDEYFQAMEER